MRQFSAFVALRLLITTSTMPAYMLLVDGPAFDPKL